LITNAVLSILEYPETGLNPAFRSGGSGVVVGE
jgi:hypothetical protein